MGKEKKRKVYHTNGEKAHLSEKRWILSPTALVTKFLTVWHATCHENARHCSADAAQFLFIEGGTFAVLSSIALLSIFLILPINLYAGTASPNDDQFIETTINHIAKGTPLLWIHFLFVVVVTLVRFGLSAIFNSVCVLRLGFLGF
uniref:CSC1/OSCA1-like N-terminal transmembrane domain-containing protein n=1 Tax=Quercus lobata TaxID=97700 RepID=A0A7N2MA06_QUELO